ncbi:mechanosensitive ion channel [Nodosilinea sp. LEGE 07298]|uniref:mechanosensitive ion channel family protein n=1 Tax=Nodosilinea sp. LEGE 07298 TaxID=2777970 RepID=UPI001881A300|nr:mechanosensitive ion channel domain-containing protein [Nodosilinea sp. LEGE 07298]MBE9111528.1 mechanosensitive ion channel [Nodosilinea sp. LEGE 07298]
MLVTLRDLLNTVDIQLLALPPLAVFLVALLLALLIGRYTPGLIGLIIQRLSPQQGATVYNNLILPIKGTVKTAGTLLLVSLSMVWLQAASAGLYGFFRPLVDLATIASVAWLASRLFRQFVRVYGIKMVRRLGREVDELLLVFETLANVVIGFIAVLAFAQSQQFNLVGLIASLGISGIALGLAAQKILEQLLSTLVLYLDRPFVPGEYIRQGDRQLCRVESIGLRSTKLRTAAKSTLIIVPNSKLVNEEIENVSRAKKVMVMLFMDFVRSLREEDAALVKQVVTRSTESLFGIDPGSTSISFPAATEPAKNGGFAASHARVTFFILGSSESSIELRKRLLEMANESIVKELQAYGIDFTLQEPTVYVESPVTL